MGHKKVVIPGSLTLIVSLGFREPISSILNVNGKVIKNLDGKKRFIELRLDIGSIRILCYRKSQVYFISCYSNGCIHQTTHKIYQRRYINKLTL